MTEYAEILILFLLAYDISLRKRIFSRGCIYIFLLKLLSPDRLPETEKDAIYTARIETATVLIKEKENNEDGVGG